ncbi:hypothetical protein [Bacillus suaedaesalsae]|uniref:DUF3298 domain-containing protein n=1 Tax=Bacillus suaedaesalsae TaxID=2810349 RepID=A0ABS2DG62_9BACI|nr:hypothetical protein [Bacillus suaedaesalsae]MBM6617401.1 hypothetical protein [Bacillus suaedaesalsae]
MKTNKKILVMSGIALALVTTIYVYLFFLSEPNDLPSERLMLKGINELQSEVQAEVLQDKIFLTDKAVFVPFVSESGDYGASYWTWKKGKWRIAHIEANDGPRIWKINPHDPSTFHFVWNLHPNDDVQNLSFYLIKRRYFQVSDGVATYDPRVQMNVSLPLDSLSYGTLKLPNEWAVSLEEFLQIKDPNRSLEQFYSFEWIAYDKEGKEFIPSKSLMGGSTSAGFENEIIDFIPLVTEFELE